MENLRFENFIDSHCHLQLNPIYDDLVSTVSKAQSDGVSNAVVCGVCPGNDWQKLIDIKRQFPHFAYIQFGLHPWWISDFKKQFSSCMVEPSSEVLNNELIEKALTNHLENVLHQFLDAGVGECGLDRSIKKTTSVNDQLHILKIHLAIAAKYRRPVTLHCVGLWGRLLDSLKEFSLSNSLGTLDIGIPAIVIHSCNSMDVNMLTPFLNLCPEIYFSFNGKTLGENACKLLSLMPMDRLLLETDSPDQLPNELRSQGFSHNQPALVTFVYESIARILDVKDFPAFTEIILNNSRKVYGISVRSLGEKSVV